MQRNEGGFGKRIDVNVVIGRGSGGARRGRRRYTVPTTSTRPMLGIGKDRVDAKTRGSDGHTIGGHVGSDLETFQLVGPKRQHAIAFFGRQTIHTFFQTLEIRKIVMRW